MKKFLQIFVLFCTTAIFAQSNSTDFDWSFNAGGGGANTTQKLQYNSQGDLLSLITVGRQTTFGTTAMYAAGFQTYPSTVTFIGKRTQSGIKSVVLKMLSNNYYASINDFTVDSDDNIIITGVAFGYSSTTNYDFGNGVILTGNGNFIAKFNPNGICQWAKIINYNLIGTTFEGQPIGLGVLPNNDIYFAGRSKNGNKPFWLLKLNASGNEVWHKEWILPLLTSVSIATSKTEYFFDNNGTAYFVLYNYVNAPDFVVDGETLTPPAGTHPAVSSLMTIKNDGTNGNFTTYRGYISDLAVEKNTGNVLLYWSEFQVNPAAPFNNITSLINNTYLGVVAMDSNRNYLGSTTYTAVNDIFINCILPLGNLNFAGTDMLQATRTVTAGGQTFTATNSTPTWKFFNNFILTKYVAHPEILGPAVNTSTYPLMAIYGNKVAVSGRYSKADNPTITINGTVLTSCEHDLTFGTAYPAYATNQNDVFIGQLNTQFNLNTQTTTKLSNFKLSPNPAFSQINLSFENNLENANLKIISLLGQTVLEKLNIFGNNLNIDVQNLSVGMYVIEVYDGNLKLNSKFVKQ